MITARFIKYENGFYSFVFESGEDMIFDQVHPKILHRYNLNEDESLIDQLFQLTFAEIEDPHDEDMVIYRVESLKPLDQEDIS